MKNNAYFCLKDAYAADKSLVVAWRDDFKSYIYPGDLTSEMHETMYEWQDRLSRTSKVLDRLSKYLSDCR